MEPYQIVYFGVSFKGGEDGASLPRAVGVLSSARRKTSRGAAADAMKAR